MKPKYFQFLYLVVAIIGIWFLAKSWLPSGYVLAGHDSGLAINITSFFKSRLYAWSDQGFGEDNSPHFGSLVTHGIDYLSSIAAGVPYAGNSLLVFFWLSMIFISAFIFGYMLKEELGDTFAIVFPPLITINFFIIQSIFILERAKYSVFVACLFILLILIKFIVGKLSLVKSVLLSSLILFIFNSGSWLGLPLYGSFFVIVFATVLFVFLKAIGDKNFKIFYKLILAIFLIGVGFVLVSGYSILPYISTFLSHDYSQLISSAVVDQNKNWLRSLSEAGSFLNFFRLQGVPDWYSSAEQVSQIHPFAAYYTKNPYLIIVSFLFPVFAFLSFVLAKSKEEKRLISLFGLLAVLGMFFMAGAHKPLGPIYEALYTKIPGFSIFRSPYYKFGPAFLIGITGMMGFSLSKVLERFGKARYFIALVFVGFWILYHWVIFYPGKIFSWQPTLSTRIQIPSYVFDFSDWSRAQNFQDGRILLLPPVNDEWKDDSYDWGYWSLTNLPSLLSNASFLNNDNLLTSEQNIWVQSLYTAIKNGDEKRTHELALRLNVNRILVRNDVLANASWSAAESPRLYLQGLQNLKIVEKEQEFDQWTLYKIKAIDAPKIAPVNRIVSIPKIGLYIMPQVPESGHFVLDVDILTKPGLQNFIENKISVYRCDSCSLEMMAPSHVLPTVNILPDSKLYVFKEIRDASVINKATDDSQKISSYLGISLRRAAETLVMLRGSTDEKYVISNVQKMNIYLEKLYEVLVSSSDPNNDFQLLSRILDGLTPIEINFQNQVGRDDFGNKGEELRTQVQSVLWNIYQIKSFYSPVLSNLDDFRTKKIFYLTFDKSGEYNFQIVSESLPKDSNGNPIFPTQVLFEPKESTSTVKSVVQVSKASFKIKVDKPVFGKIVLIFDELPNLYKYSGISTQPFPTGPESCLKVKISPFSKDSSYRINLKVSDRSQRFKFLIKSDEKFPSTSGFLHGDEEFGLDPISFGGNFSYLYETHRAKDPAIFICSVSNKAPNIDEVSVFEITSPSFTLFDPVTGVALGLLPNVTFSKTNPTEYKVNVDDVKDNFILTFNTTFSSLWKIKKANDNTYLKEDRHFAIDGYANAWVINKDDGFDFTIEYVPQKLFIYGIILTAITLTSFVIYGFWVWGKSSRK